MLITRTAFKNSTKHGNIAQYPNNNQLRAVQLPNCLCFCAVHLQTDSYVFVHTHLSVVKIKPIQEKKTKARPFT